MDSVTPGRLVMPKAVKVARAVRLLLEERGVGRVGAGIAALDVVDAELVEHGWRSASLVGERKSTPLVWRAVARSVVSKR